MAVLIFLPASTRTGIIATDLRPYLHWLLPCRRLRRFITTFLGMPTMLRAGPGAGSTRRSHLVLAYPHLAHIGLLLTALADSGRLLIGLLDTTMAQEADNVPVDIAVHPAEQLESLHLIDH